MATDDLTLRDAVKLVEILELAPALGHVHPLVLNHLTVMSAW